MGPGFRRDDDILDGPMHTLIAIPALGCDERLYEKIAPDLGDLVSLRTIMADKDRLAACVEQVLEGAPEQFIILGTSFGGRVAMEAAVATPGRVKGLVVIGSSAGATPDRAAGLRRSERLRGGEFETVIGEMAAMIAHLPGPNGPAARDAFIAMARRQGPELAARQSDALAWREDLYPRLGEIQCPALMLWGAQDQFVAAKEGLRLSMALPHARYAEVPSCGHLPPLEAPDETADTIRNWLADTGLI
jgi:pimeloyl-ACP methyl ester carboxylesterase